LSTGVRLRVAESGPQDGRAALLLPGWCESLYTFHHAFERLARAGIRTIACDLRGFGFSDKPLARHAYTLDAYCADVRALLDTLGLERVSLVGHSLGGGLALHYAIRDPARVEQLVLINPTGLVYLPYLFTLKALPRRVARSLGGRMVPRWLVRFILTQLAFTNGSRVTQDDIDQYWTPTQLPGFVYAARATVSEFDWARIGDSTLALLTVPTVVIFGRDDRLVPNASDAAERLHAMVHSLSGGHCVHEERPRETYTIIADFLRSLG
jgi:pimeloyl-ACP methyl ester carboxylesterase